LEDWKEELESAGGNKEHYKSAHHFLHIVIPWLTKILIQDGVIWLKMFPSNSAKNILIHKMTVDPKGIALMAGLNYMQCWAANARTQIKRNGRFKTSCSCIKGFIKSADSAGIDAAA
jgi:hypothetical protein